MTDCKMVIYISHMAFLTMLTHTIAHSRTCFSIPKIFRINVIEEPGGNSS